MPKAAIPLALLLVVALVHLVGAGTNLDGEQREVESFSSNVEELSHTSIRDQRNKRGKNKTGKSRKNASHRKKVLKQRKKKIAQQKKKSSRRQRKSRQLKKKFGMQKNKFRIRKKIATDKKKFRQRKTKFGKKKRNFGQHKRKTGQSSLGEMVKGSSRQPCDETALCQKIKDYIKIANHLRQAKRIIKACTLMESKAVKSITDFENTINSLTSALLAIQRIYPRQAITQDNQTTINDVSSIRDKLKNCNDTVQSQCDKTEVEGCKNPELLTKCETELQDWLKKFGPQPGSCLAASADCCSCILAIPHVSAECLVFDKLSKNVVDKRIQCINGNNEGSFGYCRNLQYEAASKGPIVAKIICQNTVKEENETTEHPLIDPILELEVKELEEDLEFLLDGMLDLTSKVQHIIPKMDNMTSKVDNTSLAVANLCNGSKCAALNESIHHLESCLADANSTDCPHSEDAHHPRIGIAHIIANADSIAHKCDISNCESIEPKVANASACLADKTSAICPAGNGTVSVKAAIAAAEADVPAVFSCYSVAKVSGTGTQSVTYSKCDINIRTVFTVSSGTFTADKAGKYRFTFMALMVPTANNEIYAYLQKTSGSTKTKVGKSDVKFANGAKEEQLTTTINVILDLKVADTILVQVEFTDAASQITSQSSQPYSVYFTGEFISA